MKHWRNSVIKLPVLLLLFILVTVLRPVAGNTLVNFRLYEGLKQTDTKTGNPSIVTAYHLTPLPENYLAPDTGLIDEKEELKKIFNLADLKLMTRTRWGWQENHLEKGLRIIILNGREFMVSLDLKKAKDTFGITVVEKEEGGYKELLNTEIILPENKNIVFGFEDSLNKPYFLSFYREKNATALKDARTLSSSETAGPKLLKQVPPIYPDAALKEHIQGDVILVVTTDTGGNVVNLKTLHGHPLLSDTVAAAIKQWKFEPYTVDGKIEPAVFIFIVTFNLDKHSPFPAKNEIATGDRETVTGNTAANS